MKSIPGTHVGLQTGMQIGITSFDIDEALRPLTRFCSTKDHEYAKVDGKTATCGITNFAQSQLGDVVYVSLPEVGASFKKG